MSIKLVLAHYLDGLRERNELDALLPDLLTAMGHSVLSRAQVGVNQAGVDVVSTHLDDDGKTVAYLFVIKFGEVGRDGFFGGKQAVESSIREASVTFVTNRLPDHLRDCEKKIVLVSNGLLKQEVQDSFSALSKEVGSRPLQSLEFWGSDQLTPFVEQFIFDESLLLEQGKRDLRAALATLEETEPSVQKFVSFVGACMQPPQDDAASSTATRKKNFLRRCAAAAMGWTVLVVWCRSAENLKPGVVGGEYLLLRLWADAVRAGLEHDPDVHARLAPLMFLHAEAMVRYYQKLAPHLKSRREVLAYRHDHVFYKDLVFEELGRLGLALLVLQQLPDTEDARKWLHQLLATFVNEHTGCLLPALDGQSIDLSLALVALAGEGDATSATNMLKGCVSSFSIAVRSGRWLPVDSDLLEDAVALQEREVAPRTYFQTSTLFPMLGTFAALLGDQASLESLAELAAQGLQGVTLERWAPTADLETFTGSEQALTNIGISKAISGLQQDVQSEMAASLKVPSGAAEYGDFKWAGTPFDVLAAVSARFHRHPLPAWYIAVHSKRMQELDAELKAAGTEPAKGLERMVTPTAEQP